MRVLRLVFVNVLVLLALFVPVELASRVYGYFFVDPDRATAWRNFSFDENVDLIRGHLYPAVRDPVIGFLPKPGTHDVRGFRVTHDADGIRANGQPAPPDGPVVLAVGDSFTWGDQVADHKTWPAALERMTGLRVINGGVFGYGLGQSLLRAEALLARLRPDAVVVGMIPDDIARVELKARTGVAQSDVRSGRRGAGADAGRRQRPDDRRPGPARRRACCRGGPGRARLQFPAAQPAAAGVSRDLAVEPLLHRRP